MAMTSETRRSRKAVAVGACAGASTLAFSQMSERAFVAPMQANNVEMQRPRAIETNVVGTSAPISAPVALSAHSAVAGGAVAVAAVGASAAGAGARSRRSARKSVKVAACKNSSSSGLPKLVELAKEVMFRPDKAGEVVGRIQAFAAEELASMQQGNSAAAQTFQEVAAGPGKAAGDHMRWVASACASMLMTFTVTMQPANALDQVTYTDFLTQVQKGDVEMVRVQSDLLTAQYTAKDGSKREVNLIPNPAVEDALFNTLAEKKVDVVMQNASANAGGPQEFFSKFAGPIAWLIAGLLVLFGGAGAGGGPGMPGGMGGAMGGLGKSPAKVVKDGDTKTKFADVAGCDGAKEELVEVVDFLKNSTRYSELGAKIPKGALLVGPPGTGKTLLAKAVAGEAGVPFFSCSASEFIEVYAGIGASRVRDLFAEAKKSAPCIIFIDEIDAVGRQRGGGMGQGNDEREQTVNQLLTEMDGFEGNNGVVVLAATNRADILDKALVRPGRFDRQIQVDPPDVEGRTAILKVHAQSKTLAPSVDLIAVARQTPGMSGADLANLLNEGAIIAARSNKTEVDQDDISNALERISIGMEKKDAVMTEKKRKLVAYHEAGHAILGALMSDFDIVAKISIVPRGPAGGVTIFMPSEERLNTGLYSKEFLENRMCVALGGRIAEELINGKDNVTTGASNDFQQCTQVANAMITQLGMSGVVGQRVVGGESGEAPPVSQNLRRKVDGEVKRIVDEQYARGMFLLKSNMYIMDGLADMLLDQEKVGGDELMKLINKAAVEGKLVTTEQMPEPAMAAYTGEKPSADDDVVAACAVVSRRRGAKREVREAEVVQGSAVSSQQVFERVASMANEAVPAVPASVVQKIGAQVLATLAATAMPLAAHAADIPPPAPAAAPVPMMQQAQTPQPGQVSGRATYSRLLEFVEGNQVKKLDFYDMGRTAIAQVVIGDRVQQLQCDLPGTTSGLIEKLAAKGVNIDVHTPEKPNEAFKILGDIAFPLLVIVGLLFLRSQSGGAGGGMPGMPGTQSKAKIQLQPDTGVKFEDVAGIEEAKEELTEIVDFLKAPERFVKVGAKIPRGVLLTGPPGTGKTLMAKALAGESGVPFIQASAAEFIEMFVGVGASRVRDIFKQAKEKAPCIIFIDEIDAIGRQRGAGMGGGNDEREQTLNQILTEMDGFEGNSGVIVVAATNRSDILDSALLRPGRFDRRVEVGLPDVKGRKDILKVHVKNKKLDEGVDLQDVAQRSAGMSGADLENLMNESAILTARRNKKAITNLEIADATDRVIAGLEGRALVDNASKKLIAYHECGKALVGTLLPYHDPVNKVTLVPRGQSKGLTWFTPNEDQSLISQATLKARIAGTMGGRAAERVVFGEAQVTSSASGDLQQVDRFARAMVTQLGMSEVGQLTIDQGGMLGPSYSEELAEKIDDAISKIADEGYLQAMEILIDNRACLDKLTEELLDVETLSGARLTEIVTQYTTIPEKLSAV